MARRSDGGTPGGQGGARKRPARRRAAGRAKRGGAAAERQTVVLEPGDEEARHDISAVVVGEGVLWVASDEGGRVERLTRQSDGRWGAATAFALSDLLVMPGAPDDEVDVEGLDVADGWLWVVGSHSAKRRKADAGKGAAKQIERLTRIETGGNRNLLARIPLEPDENGGAPRPVAVRRDGARAARLDASAHGGTLLDVLRVDPHLGPFVGLPGKENGLDIEGMAVMRGRVRLGLRGPVLRGWAVVLGVAPVAADGDPTRLVLPPIGPDGRPYEKHFLDLRGLGTRELCADGDDLLILAGPTMTLDGDALVVRWPRAAKARGDSMVAREKLEVVAELPYGSAGAEGVEHPEGMTLMEADGARRLLVAYDSPRASRLVGKRGVRADLFALR